MKRKAWQGGLSLVELIVALTLLSGVLLMTVTVRFNFQGLVNMGMNQAILFLNTHLALDRIVSAIQHANYLEIDAPNSTLTLSRKVGEDYISSRYYRDPGGNLCYQPDLSASPLPSPEIVLPSVTGFQLTGFPEGGERFQMARVRLEAEDPQGIARRDAMFQTAAFCRIFHGINKPVRVVTRDSSGNVTTVKGSYDTIQAAIDAATTLHGDVVQVSSNGKTPYVEMVGISKALTLEGGYDSVDWKRHYADPAKPGQIHEDYETIIVSPRGAGVYIPEPSFPTNVTIAGFTIQNTGYGIYAKSDDVYHPLMILIKYNKIFNTEIGISLSGQGCNGYILGNIIGNTTAINNTQVGNEVKTIMGIQSGMVNDLVVLNNQFENVSVSFPKYSVSSAISASYYGWVIIHNNSFNNLYTHDSSVNEVIQLSPLKSILFRWTRVSNNSFSLVNGCCVKIKNRLAANSDLFLELSNNAFEIAGKAVECVGGGHAEELTFVNNRINSTGSYRLLSSDLSGSIKINNNNIRGEGTGDSLISISGFVTLDLKNNSIYPRDFAAIGEGVRLFTTWPDPFIYVLKNDISGFEKGLTLSADPLIKGGYVANNIFANNAVGVTFTRGTARDEFLFSNNTFYRNKTGVELHAVVSLRVNNSILWENTDRDFYITGGHGSSRWNRIEFNNMQKGVVLGGDASSVAVKEENNISVDPKFVDLNNHDYSLRDTSLCIDAGNTVIDVAKPAKHYFDPSDNLSMPPNLMDRARLPAKGTIKTDIGAYGGPYAGVIGFVQPTVDDPSTPLIREDVIGTY